MNRNIKCEICKKYSGLLTCDYCNKKICRKCDEKWDKKVKLSKLSNRFGTCPKCMINLQKLVDPFTMTIEKSNQLWDNTILMAKIFRK